jgi:3-phytase
MMIRQIFLTFIVSLNFKIPLFAQSSNIPNGVPFDVIEPFVITQPTAWDTDDPAIWIHPTKPKKSLIIGTDKNIDGALYVFDLKGQIVQIVPGLSVPNNVDVAYGFPFNGKKIDIAVVTERLKQRLRVYQLPEMMLLDMGDLIVFNGDTERAPMGVALYQRKKDSSFHVIVSGKSGPEEGYLGQYLLEDNGQGQLKISLLRQFGKFSGRKEIEAIAVDSELGYVYYSDETVGIRKYHADPDIPGADNELALFATSGFARDHEGISIYKIKGGKGYILVSDQQANQFWIFTREGSPNDPHDHCLVKIVKVAAQQSDGNAVTSMSLTKDFSDGLFVAMSNDKTFHYYKWQDIAGPDLRVNKNNKKNRKKISK